MTSTEATASQEAFIRPSPRNPRATFALFQAVLVVTVLYCAQQVLIPIALALLLVFVLSPVVDFFERLGLGRIISVASVVVLTFAVLGVIGAGLATQTLRLADELPRHKENIRAKVGDLREATRDTLFSRAQSIADDMMAELEKKEAAPRKSASPGSTAAPAPVPVVMEGPSVLWQIPSLFETLASVGLVFVLVVFMLLERRELRDRIIRLAGSRRLALTTKALDEAGGKISRYLLAQSAINATYGIAIGIGLFALGVPFALLWGFLAAMLRFIPYVGPWLGMALPVTLALAVSPGWSVPLMALALFVVVELTVNMIVEPLLYGQSAGVSQTALLVAVAFWTWLWGPVGLILATPLTVCVAVLCKHVPELESLYFLTASEAAFTRDTRFYQRLVAADRSEAVTVLTEALENSDPRAVYDELLLPAIARTRRDRLAELISEDEERQIYELLRDIGDEIPAAEAPREVADEAAQPAEAAPQETTVVLGIPAQDEGDALALEMLSRIVGDDRLQVVWHQRMRSLEVLSSIEETGAHVICIAAFASRGLPAARYLCRRLRRRFPELTIVVLAWGAAQTQSNLNRLHGDGANRIATSLQEAAETLLEITSGRERSQKEMEDSVASELRSAIA